MSIGNRFVELERIECELCLREVPLSEATSGEATDYVAYFCGLDCYEKWRSQTGSGAADGKQSGP